MTFAQRTLIRGLIIAIGLAALPFIAGCATWDVSYAFVRHGREEAGRTWRSNMRIINALCETVVALWYARP